MKWIPANNPPDKDTFCFIACKRADGSIYIPNYQSYYTVGIQYTINSPIYKGFMHPRVIAWLHIPGPYTRNKKGWILISEREPEKRDDYIVSTYDQQGKEWVGIAFYEPGKLIFYGQPNVIAWMPIPKVKIA